MKSKLYVGNLPIDITELDLETLFMKSGTVMSVSIPKNTNTGDQHHFGFVEMINLSAAMKAIDDRHSKEYKGKILNVSIANNNSGSRFLRFK